MDPSMNKKLYWTPDGNFACEGHKKDSDIEIKEPRIRRRASWARALAHCWICIQNRLNQE